MLIALIPRLEAGALQARRDPGAGRPLALGPGDVHGPEAPFRMPEPRQDVLHRLQVAIPVAPVAAFPVDQPVHPVESRAQAARVLLVSAHGAQVIRSPASRCSIEGRFVR